MLVLLKRKADYNPIKVVMYGNDYSATINCTLCGEPQFIECVDGKLRKDNLILKEDNNGEESEESQTAKKDDEESSSPAAGGQSNADSTSESNGKREESKSTPELPKSGRSTDESEEGKST